MAHEHDDDFYKLTFSQREGKVPLPEPMRLEYVPQRFRQLVWQVIDGEIKESSRDLYGHGSWNRDPNLGSIVEWYKFDVLGMLHDEIGWYNPETTAHFFKGMIAYDSSYHETLTLIEFVLRHEYCSESLRNGLIDAFDKAPVAYFVQEVNGCFTIIPRVSPEAGEATRQAIQSVKQARMEGASTHLGQAAEHINAERFPDSVRESIHAVESVARQIGPKSNTLGDALEALTKNGILTNSQLKTGLEKIYSYTNTEQGIRHALLDTDSPDVGLDEAMFMFGACASFAAYLVNKHRQMQGQEDRDQ